MNHDDKAHSLPVLSHRSLGITGRLGPFTLCSLALSLLLCACDEPTESELVVLLSPDLGIDAQTPVRGSLQPDAQLDAGPMGFPAPAVQRPRNAAEEDPRFTVEPIKSWCLIGNELTAGDDELSIKVHAEGDVEFVDTWVGQSPGLRLTKVDGGFAGVINLTEFAPGEFEVILAADGSDTPFAQLTFVRSHPLYVVVGTDWDDSDNSDTTLELQQALHDHSPELKLTHFVGPYTFTDPTMTPERINVLVDWLTGMRDNYGDEIGVHIHPYCNFVETTDVPCRLEPSVVYDAGDRTGFTVSSAAYTEEEYTEFLLATDTLFIAYGLGKPTSFRAGAWTADMSTLQALVNTGYTVDSDAFNWARMEEWIGLGNGAFYEWVRDNWSSIGDTSQPYYPSADDILVPGDPALPLLEVPLNGVMADYVTGAEMIEIFQANWPGGPLQAPVAYALGYHPPNFNANYQQRILTALAHIDTYLYSGDAGPVVYATFNELTAVWTPPL